MASVEIGLTRAAILLSIFLVLVLSGLAIYSVLDREGGSRPVDLRPDDDDASAGPFLDIDDRDLPLTIGCLEVNDSGEAFAVVVINRAATTVDYLVSVDFTGPDERRGSATTEIGGLNPGEERSVAVRPDDSVVTPVDCSIAAVQTDRRLLLTNS